MSELNIVNRTEPLQIGIEIKQGANTIGATTMLALHWPSLSAEERRAVVESTARSVLDALLKELTYE